MFRQGSSPYHVKPPGRSQSHRSLPPPWARVPCSPCPKQVSGNASEIHAVDSWCFLADSRGFALCPHNPCAIYTFITPKKQWFTFSFLIPLHNTYNHLYNKTPFDECEARTWPHGLRAWTPGSAWRWRQVSGTFQKSALLQPFMCLQRGAALASSGTPSRI